MTNALLFSSSDHHTEYGHVFGGEYGCSANRFETVQGRHSTKDQARWFCSLLQLDEKSLGEGLLRRTIFAHGEAVVTPLNREQAFDVRYDPMPSDCRHLSSLSLH